MRSTFFQNSWKQLLKFLALLKNTSLQSVANFFSNFLSAEMGVSSDFFVVEHELQ